MVSCISLILILFICCCMGAVDEKNASRFFVEYEWSMINFSWENKSVYQEAVASNKYIPENNVMAGVKYYKNIIYVAIPRIREGTPVTLGYVVNTSVLNPPIAPFPDWPTNDVDGDCENILESVQSMEVDANGIIWVIDGHRTRSRARCPPKLVLYDLNNNANSVHTFVFPETVCLTRGCFLNDIVVDDQDGGFAYITEHGVQDPGLIVYSRAKDRAWKLRDASMFAESEASNFVVNNSKFSKMAPIDGIALSPGNRQGSRHVYYCALAGVSLYSISTEILKNENQVSRGDWRRNVTYVGAKQAQSDGMVFDNAGTLYYGLLPLYGVGSWKMNEDFSNARVIDTNNKTMIWTDSFAFDDKGHLYLLTNNIHKFFNLSFHLELTPEVQFRILKLFTSRQSYLY